MTGDGPADDPPASLAPEEAFALLGNEVRADIVRALGEALKGEGPAPPVSFSALRERCAPDVDSGQFNYHLDRLRGHFVARVDGGYRLRSHGARLYRATVAGTFNRRPTVEPFEVGHACHYCGEPIVAEYDGTGAFLVRCDGCDYLYQGAELPPRAVEDADPSTLLRRFDRHVRGQSLAYASGVCPHCATDLETAFYPPEAVSYPVPERRTVLIHRHCPHCAAEMYLPVGEVVLFHPTLVSFFHERGLDVTGTPLWELPFVATDRSVTVRSREPWTVAVAVERGGDELELVIDGALDVVETTVRSA